MSSVYCKNMEERLTYNFQSVGMLEICNSVLERLKRPHARAFVVTIVVRRTHIVCLRDKYHRGIDAASTLLVCACRAGRCSGSMPSANKTKSSCQQGGTGSCKLDTAADPAAEVQLHYIGNVQREIGRGAWGSTSVTALCAEATENMPFLRCTNRSPVLHTIGVGLCLQGVRVLMVDGLSTRRMLWFLNLRHGPVIISTARTRGVERYASEHSFRTNRFQSSRM